MPQTRLPSLYVDGILRSRVLSSERKNWEAFQGAWLPPLSVFLMRAFPSNLAKVVAGRWKHMVAGDYETPPCPPENRLRELLEIAYLAAGAPEEARYPQFNVVAVPDADEVQRNRIGCRWPFDEPRPLSVSELRRLAPAVDAKKSAIWLEWGKDGWQVVGLVDFGTSWHRARMGLEYQYQNPSCLVVHVEGPGRMRVYQGGFRVAMLTNGQIEGHEGVQLHPSLYPSAKAGLAAMDQDLVRPKVEEPREFAEFEFTALWNTYAAIANSISLDGHGGAVIIVPTSESLPFEGGRVKYRQSSSVPRSAFIEFMNARHKLLDLIVQQENEQPVSPEQLSYAELAMRDTYAKLVDATRFVAQLAGCDGAIVISEDLHCHGFGCEVSAELRPGTKVLEGTNEMRKEGLALDVENFGMRHRSAIKLVSQQPRYCILVVSQDGPISTVWSENGLVFVQKTLNLVNLNFPWA